MNVSWKVMKGPKLPQSKGGALQCPTRSRGVTWVALFGLSLAGCYFSSSGVPALPTVPAGAAPAPPLSFPYHELGDDSIVRLVTPYTACTGTLIDRRLVLTAHHCVAKRDADGGYLEEDVAPSAVDVQLGGDYLPWGEATVAHVVTPPCGFSAGEGDIAVLVLAKPLADISVRAVDLESRPTELTQVEPIGFGQCADSGEGIRLHERDGGAISRVLATRFQAPTAICPGDSGGPAMSEDGFVIGVVSAGALDGQQATRNLTEFTRVDQWQDVFSNATRIAEGVGAAELPPIGGCPTEPQL